ncbi:MAG: tyrosine-type recombinase/integrase [Hyphomicrobiales bacterium]
MATIRPRGDKYQVQVRRTGQPQLSKTFFHRRDAEVWARQMEVKADRNELPQGAEILKSLTLADLVERYLRSVSSTKKNKEWEKIVLSAFLRHPICKKRLSHLKSSDFASYRDERLASIKPKSLKRQLSPVHNLFEIARSEWGIPLKENPLDKVRIRFTDNKRERRLEEGELEKILEVTQGLPNPHVTPIIKLAVLTGMRRGEILGIKPKHVDAHRRLLRIPDSKNGRSRTYPSQMKLWLS